MLHTHQPPNRRHHLYGRRRRTTRVAQWPTPPIRSAYDPAINTIGTIAAIPRATGETRALTFNDDRCKNAGYGRGQSRAQSIQRSGHLQPATNTWTTGTPVPAFMTARRNFPTDTDGINRIWLAGGYDSTGLPTARWKGSAPAEDHRQHLPYRDHLQRRLRANREVRPGRGHRQRR